MIFAAVAQSSRHNVENVDSSGARPVSRIRARDGKIAKPPRLKILGYRGATPLGRTVFDDVFTLILPIQ